jgi:quercetin dioxygenase-like cupin family protein
MERASAESHFPQPNQIEVRDGKDQTGISRTDTSVTRREFDQNSFLSLLSAIALPLESRSIAGTAADSASSRRVVIKQSLPGNPERQLTLVEVVYPPGQGSPPHLHANGVMAFVVSGSIASRVGDGPEQVFRAGDGWWEPVGAIHRVSRNASFSEEARLLAIYIAPPEASEADLMRPI